MMARRTVVAIAVCTTLLFVGGTLSLAEERYLQVNVHAQQGRKDVKASYANWTDPGAGHVIIAVNTPVETKKWKRGFILKPLAGDIGTVFFEFHPVNMGMTVAEYIDLITGPEKIDLSALSEADRKGIEAGQATTGMTKEGVRIALGHPAAHATRSLDANTWTYWTNRFRRTLVEFDESGKVK